MLVSSRENDTLNSNRAVSLTMEMPLSNIPRNGGVHTVVAVREHQNQKLCSTDLIPIPPTRKAKKPLPKPRPLPAFEPLRVEGYDSCGTPNLPPYIDPHDAFTIFKPFFTDEILDKLVEWTNKCAELYPLRRTLGGCIAPA